MADEKEVKEEPKEEMKEEKPAEEAKAEEKPAEEAKEEKPAEEVKEEKKEEKPAEEAKEEKKEEPKKEEPAPKAEAKVEEKPAAPPKEEAKVELSKEAQKIVDTLKDMSVLELSKLVKELESVFGVSAAAPVAAAGAPAAGGPAEGGEEKTSFDVVLTAAGDKKIQVIKEVRTITGLGLKEAKAVVDAAPKPVKQGVTKEEADKVKAQLEGAGAQVEVK